MRTIKALFILPALLTSVLALAKTSVDAVQLDHVAIDSSLKCGRILFESSQNFTGVLYVVPRVRLGTGIVGSRSYEITPTLRPGISQLAVKLFFPTDDESYKTSNASNQVVDTEACDFDEVKLSLNKNRDAKRQIHTIANMLLTSFEVNLPGVAYTAMVGRNAANEETDILDYLGKDMVATFEINENERRLFESQLVTKGVTASIRYRFQASRRNGSVHVQADVENIAKSLTANAGLKKLKFLNAAQISALFQESVTATSVTVDVKAGDTDMSRTVDMLTNKLISEINMNLEKIQKEEKKSSAQGKEGAPLEVVLNILRTKAQTNFNLNLFSGPEVATAQSQRWLKADRLNDPDSIEVVLKTGVLDPSTGMDIKKGQSMIITPAYYSYDEFKFAGKKRLITKNQIARLDLGAYFNDLSNPNLVVDEVEINGRPVAIGNWNPYVKYDWLKVNAISYRWVRTEKFRQRIPVESGLLKPNLEELQQLPVHLIFSNLGDRQLFKLGDLTKENEYWSAIYDTLTGRLILTAKEDLGVVRFRSFAAKKTDLETKAIILDEVTQERVVKFSSEGTAVSTATLREDPRAIVRQRTIGLSVTRPRYLNPAQIQRLKKLSPTPLGLSNP